MTLIQNGQAAGCHQMYPANIVALSSDGNTFAVGSGNKIEIWHLFKVSGC